MEMMFQVSNLEAILLILANSSMNIIPFVYFLLVLTHSSTGGKPKLGVFLKASDTFYFKENLSVAICKEELNQSHLIILQ